MLSWEEGVADPCWRHIGSAHAGVIASVTTVALPGLSTAAIGPIGVTPAQNNDNTAAASPNKVPYIVFFNGTPGSLQVEFVTNDSGGTTEYRFTLRQTPIVATQSVPEPSAQLLPSFAGLLALLSGCLKA